jgi:hypothetical protein
MFALLHMWLPFGKKGKREGVKRGRLTKKLRRWSESEKK